METLNIAIIGSDGCGKTSYIKKCVERFSNQEKSECVFRNVRFVFHEYALNDILDYSIDGYIILFNVQDKSSFEKSVNFIKNYQSTKPLVWCGTYVDQRNRLINWKTIKSELKKYNIKYFDISSKSEFAIDRPLIEFVRIINPKIDFIIKQELNSEFQKLNKICDEIKF